MLTNSAILTPRLRHGGRLAAAVMFCGLVLMMCSGLSHAQRQTLSLGTVQTIGPIHQAPCVFPVQNDEWDTSDSTLTECHTLSVYGCPNSYDANNPLPPLTAYVAVNHQASGTTPLGTIVLLSGDGGTSFFRAGDGTSQYVVDYYNDPLHHFTTVQVAWAAPWEDNTANPPPSFKSVKDEACRPATLLKYINDNYAVSSTGAMCAHGHSGGASAIAYAMEFYGADRAVSGGYLDTVVMSSGPTQADIKNGCHYDQASQAPVTNVCQGGVCVGAAQSWPSCLRYPMGGHADCFNDNTKYPTGGKYDTAQAVNMHTVGDFQQPAANCANWTGLGNDTGTIDPDWQAMSLVPVPYGHYPQTFMYGFLCQGRHVVDGEDVSNNSAAQGWSYLNVVSPSPAQGTRPAIYRVNKCADPEMIWKPDSEAVGANGLTGYQESKRVMTTFCAVHP